MKLNVLNYYKSRIPSQLRKLTIKTFTHKSINFRSINYNSSLEKQISNVKWADVLLLTPGRFLHKDVLDNAKHIKLIQIWSSGYEKLNIKAIKTNKIPLANNGSVNSTSVAEHTILLILSVFRKIIYFNNIAKKGKWEGNSHGLDCFNLSNKNIGLVGYGNVGKKVARICKAFGANIYFNDIVRKKKNYLNAKYLPLDKLFKISDVVSLHLHYNRETKNIINKSLLSLMKKNSILINVSRAGLVDNKYLNKMLKNNRIKGAGFDVFIREPTKKGDIYLDNDNVVLSPHTAGATIDTHKEVLLNCKKNILNLHKKNTIKWLVKL